MATVGFKKISYSDEPTTQTDTINKNFALIEWILANGKLDGTNISQAYIQNLKVDVANITGTLTVGVNVGIGEALSPVEQAIAEKKRVFVTTPYPPYDIGDLWVPSTTGEMRRCQVSRQTGVYNAGDWRLCLDYTTPTGVVTIIDGEITADRINALQVVAGSVSADNITAGTISGVTLSGQNVIVEDVLKLSSVNFDAGIEWQTADVIKPSIFIDPGSGALFFTGGDGAGVYANNRRIDIAQTAVFG
jgi:hypothetical protein